MSISNKSGTNILDSKSYDRLTVYFYASSVLDKDDAQRTIAAVGHLGDQVT